MELIGLNQTLTQLGLPIEPLFTLELVLAEVLNNIVEHAYEDSGNGLVELSVIVREHRICCDVRDRGKPLPHTRLPRARRYEPDAMEVVDLPEGGFGWGLIHDMSRTLHYRREHGANHLSFEIDLPA